MSSVDINGPEHRASPSRLNSEPAMFPDGKEETKAHVCTKKEAGRARDADVSDMWRQRCENDDARADED